MNPHAQSKDPCTLLVPQSSQGVLPESPGSLSHRKNSKPDATVESHPSQEARRMGRPAESSYFDLTVGDALDVKPDSDVNEPESK